MGAVGSVAEWLVHTRSDLSRAKPARNQADILPAQVCFHAQQAGEKTLKPVLLHCGIDFPLVPSLSKHER